MARRRRRDDRVLGARSLERFDVCIIGSGAGGASAAHVLTAAGKKVLVLEAGLNAYPGLDRPGELPPPLHSNDELKFAVRGWLEPSPLLEPRTFRERADQTAAIHDDVNVLPKAVGGAFQHADGKVPRFNAVDFRLKSAVEELVGRQGVQVPGFGDCGPPANFADWPFSYEDLEPYYAEAERLYGVQGAEDNPYASPRSQPFPMPPGVPMWFALLLAEGCRRTTFLGAPITPHTYPGTHNSRFYDGRPPCNDCGPCSGYGCPNHAKGAPPVTTLRRALLSGNCQLRYEAQVVRLRTAAGRVTAVEYVDGDGALQTATADAYVLAASAIESARLCFLSGPSPTEPLGNSSGQVGRNLMFHAQTNVNGFFPKRVHGQRGRAVTHGHSDFRGVEPGGAAIRVVTGADGGRYAYLGGICEFVASQGQPITENGRVYALELQTARFGTALKTAMRDLPLGQHLFGLLMQAEDAPQLSNRVDLDPTVRDVFGLPVARVTYRSHPFELSARRFYVPVMREIVANAGATAVFVVPCDAALGAPPSTRHVMGTLRMGTDPAASVVNPAGAFWDVDNLYCVDGSVFPTGSGYNPTLTIIAVALRIAHGMAGTTPAAP